MPKGGNKNQEPVTYTTYLLNGNEYYHDTAFANATSSILNSVDGQLFTIESAAEQNLIYDWLGHYYPDVVWMGISDSVQEGDWRYDDGPLVGQSLVYETGDQARPMPTI